MKKKYIFGSIWLILIIMIPLKNSVIKASLDGEKRAVWLSYIDMDNLKNKTEKDFRDNFSEIIDECKSDNLNTLIVQVRAFEDAIYPSEKFPWASYITDSALNYDPLEIMVQLTHEANISIEAWINPYRIATSKVSIDRFKAKSPIADWIGTDKIITYNNGNSMMLNPANDDAIDYIVSGVEELLMYDIDGIHMDDYFYVKGAYGKTTKQERLKNVNEMVKKIYLTVKSKNKNITFGISCAGNTTNARNDGADIDTWLTKKGYIDYLMPQIYWSDEYGSDGSITKFSNVLKEFMNLRKNDITLYSGLALYKTNEYISDDRGWHRKSTNIAEQYNKLKDMGYSGFSLFSYSDLRNNKEVYNLKKAIELRETHKINSFYFSGYDVAMKSYNKLKKDTNWYLDLKKSNTLTKTYRICTGGFEKKAVNAAISYLSNLTGDDFYGKIAYTENEYGFVNHIETGGIIGKEEATKNLEEIKKETGWYIDLMEYEDQANVFYLRTGGFIGEKNLADALNKLKKIKPDWYLSVSKEKEIISYNTYYKIYSYYVYDENKIRKLLNEIQKNKQWYVQADENLDNLYLIKTGGFVGQNSLKEAIKVFESLGWYYEIE